MATYTLTITGSNGHQHNTLADFPDDATIIADVRTVVDPEHPTIAIGRGSGGDVQYLGAWDWCAGDPKWTPEE